MQIDDYLSDYDSYLNFLVLESRDYEGVVVEAVEDETEHYIDTFSSDCVVQEEESKLVVQDGFFRVDKATGEILGEYVKSPYQPITRKEYEKEYKIVPSPYNARSQDDIEAYIKLNVDKRKVIMVNNIDNRAGDDLCRVVYGEGKRTKTMTKPQYKILQTLAKHISHHNVIVCTRKHLSLILGIQENHIMRNMKIVEPHVRVVTDGVQRGSIKLLINPDLVFKAQGNVLNALRKQALESWYFNKGWKFNSYAEYIEYLMQPSNRVVVDAEEFEFEGKKFSKEFLNWLDNWKKTKS